MPTRSEPELAAALIPPEPTIDDLVAAVSGCQACDLYRHATQSVFGQGSDSAELMLVGEQPGDREDREGEPFVGPAGRVLDEGLEQAGIDRQLTYVTNVVKHFKWEGKGKVRIHKTPNRSEQAACRPWLEAELAVVRPSVLVALGATAAKSLFGNDFRVTVDRGRRVPSELAPHALATVHPSSILRGDPEDRAAAMAAFVADLRVAADVLGPP